MLFWLAIILTVGLLAAFALGLRRAHEPHQDALGPVGTSLLALLGLLLAFSVSAAWNRYHDRLELVIDEANAIGTLQLRLDLLPSEKQASARNALRTYVQSRIAANQRLAAGGGSAPPDQGPAKQLWSTVFSGVQPLTNPADRSLLVQSLNETLDLAAKRRVQASTHIPLSLALVLGLTSLVSAFLVGRELASQPASLKRVGWAFMVCVAATLFSIFDLEDPRMGFIRVDNADQLLVEIEADLG